MAATVDIGTVIRSARAAARLTQSQLGLACGYSPSAVSRIEAGKMQPGREALLAIAAALRLQPERLGVTSGTVDAAIVARPDWQEDVVRRRSMLAGMVGVGVTAALGPGAQAAADEPDDAAVERSLFRLPDAPAASRAALGASLARARKLFHEAQYTELGRQLPTLISASLSTGAHDTAARSYVLLAQLAIKNYQGYSWVAADRAREQAKLAGDPVVMGEADHSMAITMRRSGEYQAAIDRLREAADRLGGKPDQLALRGSLLLTASYSAAQAGWRGQALDFIGEAEETATRRETAAQTLYIPGVFGMDQTHVFRISVHHALGEGDQALAYASKVDPRRLPNAERRGRMCMDVARVWRDLGEPGRAFSALRAMELYAPQEARRPKVRAITSELLTGNGEIPGLRLFAQRTGALA